MQSPLFTTRPTTEKPSLVGSTTPPKLDLELTETMGSIEVTSICHPSSAFTSHVTSVGPAQWSFVFPNWKVRSLAFTFISESVLGSGVGRVFFGMGTGPAEIPSSGVSNTISIKVMTHKILMAETTTATGIDCHRGQSFVFRNTANIPTRAATMVRIVLKKLNGIRLAGYPTDGAARIQKFGLYNFSKYGITAWCHGDRRIATSPRLTPTWRNSNAKTRGCARKTRDCAKR